MRWVVSDWAMCRVCREDVEVLTKGGFKVIREKIEAVAGITQGVPETKDDVRSTPHSCPVPRAWC